MTADLTPAQAARLEAIEAAPWAEVRLSPNGRDVAIRRGDNDWRVSNGGHYRDLHVADWLPMAVAAVDVMRGATDDGAIKEAPCGCRYTGHAGLRDVHVIERCERHTPKRARVGAPATAEGDGA